jgi:hypothetical protein
MNFKASKTYLALPEYAKPAWLKTIRALPPTWLLPPTTGERFKGRNHYLKRLNRYRLLKGFAVVSGRVWKELTPRWQFLYKIYSKATANKRELEARKAKDEEDSLVINRQRNTMIKAKLDYRFKYILFYKLINYNSKEKEYIRTLRCLKYIYLIHLNPFSFKIYEIETSEY